LTKKTKTKSPLRYPGGKSKLLKEILAFKPENVKEYREPFLGGGSLLFHLLSDAEIQSLKGTDTFKELILFYEAMLQSPHKLVEAIEKMKMTYAPKDLYTISKRLVVDQKASWLERAASFFVLNRITFSGLTLSGGFSQASYDGRFKKSHIEKCSTFQGIKKDIQIFLSSYEELLHSPSSFDDKEVWVFLDPPYDIKSSNLYGKNGDGHKSFDHVKLAEECKKCKYPFLITYNDNDTIRNLYQGWANIHEIDVIYSMNSSGKRKKELFITNYQV
jgi:DNA adenine methylase